MKDTFRLKQTAEASILRRNMKNKDQLHVAGVYHIECYDKDGNLKWSDVAHNAVVNQGLNAVLNTYFGNALSSGSVSIVEGFAIGLVNNGETFAATDTHSSHAGWTEFTAYTDPSNGDSNLSRPVWGASSAGSGGTSPGDYPVAASSAQSLTNSSPVLFDITGSGTIAGLFLAAGTLTLPTPDILSGPGTFDANAKGETDTGPILFSEAAFSTGDQSVVSSDTLRVTYTLNAS
jgi:hypothetical protein